MKLFFSWQSDRPEVKQFLRNTLQKLCGELKIEYDEDSRGEDSAEYILDNILRKIDNSTVVIGDLTSIGENIEGEKIPNPNVSFEVGYAEAKVTRKNLILVFCSDFGTHDDLPFDLSKRSMPSFSLKNPESMTAFISRLRKALSKITAEPSLTTVTTLNTYEKTLLYWLHQHVGTQITSTTYGVSIRRFGSIDSKFHEDFSHQDKARFTHAITSLSAKGYLIHSKDGLWDHDNYDLSEEGELVAQTIPRESVKPLVTKDNSEKNGTTK